MTYGRSVSKALDKFGLDVSRWQELAADREAWREMLRTGLAPPAFRPRPPSSLASPAIATAARTHQADAALRASHQRGHRRDAAVRATPAGRHYQHLILPTSRQSIVCMTVCL